MYNLAKYFFLLLKVMYFIFILPFSLIFCMQQPVMDPQPPRPGLTRIPMSRGMKTGKAVPGALVIHSNVKIESKGENQSMRIELKKPSISSLTPSK